MMRSARLLAVAIIAALTLPPSARPESLKPFRSPVKRIPGGPRVVALPDLSVNAQNMAANCIDSSTVFVSFDAKVTNSGDTAAAMPLNVWGQTWVKLDDMAAISWGAGWIPKYVNAPPWLLPAHSGILFPMQSTAMLLCIATRSGCIGTHIDLRLTVDPNNHIWESNENNNVQQFSVSYDKNFCK
jgi:hypothetical protein